MTAFTLTIFLGVFAIVVLLMNTRESGPSSKAQLASQAIFPKANAGGSGHDAAVDLRKSVVLSAIPLINRWLLKFELAPRLRLALYQADLKWTAGSLILMCMACFAVPVFVMNARTANLKLALLVGLLTSLAPIGYVWFKRNKRFEKFEQLLPEALDLMVSALRAGHSLNAAIDLVSRECEEPIRKEFRTCFDEQNYGLELRTAMDNMIVRVPLQDLKISTTAILIQKESGGNLAEVLNKTSEVIRERFRLKRQVRTHTAHGRLTGIVISALPLALLLVMYVINPRMVSILWTNALGVKLLYAAGGMMVVGGLIIRKIVNMDV